MKKIIIIKKITRKKVMLYFKYTYLLTLSTEKILMSKMTPSNVDFIHILIFI